MDTFTAIITAISSVGFPIVMCLLLVFQNKQNNDNHGIEQKELRQAIENNTLVIQKLVDRWDSAIK